jgi:hypothetical protein
MHFSRNSQTEFLLIPVCLAMARTGMSRHFESEKMHQRGRVVGLVRDRVLYRVADGNHTGRGARLIMAASGPQERVDAHYGD